jgi:hypothetical protein
MTITRKNRYLLVWRTAVALAVSYDRYRREQLFKSRFQLVRYEVVTASPRLFPEWGVDSRAGSTFECVQRLVASDNGQFTASM